MLPAQFGIPGGPELLIVLLIAVLLFGASKIPKLARSSGEAIGEFKKGRQEIRQELEQMREEGTAGDKSESTTESSESDTSELESSVTESSETVTETHSE